MPPLYVYRCEHCGAERADMRTIEARHDSPVCRCHGPMVLIINAVRGIVKEPAVPKSWKRDK